MTSAWRLPRSEGHFRRTAGASRLIQGSAGLAVIFFRLSRIEQRFFNGPNTGQFRTDRGAERLRRSKLWRASLRSLGRLWPRGILTLIAKHGPARVPAQGYRGGMRSELGSRPCRPQSESGLTGQPDYLKWVPARLNFTAIWITSLGTEPLTSGLFGVTLDDGGPQLLPFKALREQRPRCRTTK